jgi:ABC-2 type transport system permease protein
MSSTLSLRPRAVPPAAFAKIVLNEARLVARSPRALVYALALPVLLLVLFGNLKKFQVHKPSLGGLTLFDTYIPVLICMVIALLCLLSLPGPLASYREQGILRRLSTTPAPPAWVLAAQVVINLCLAVLAIFIIVVVGIAAFGEHAPNNIGGFVLAIVLAVAALLSLGLVLAALAKTAQGAYVMGGAVFFPLIFLAGLWLPRPDMPTWLQHISNYTPLGAAVEAMQHSMTGGFPPAAPLLTLAGYTVLLAFLAIRYFKWE